MKMKAKKGGKRKGAGRKRDYNEAADAVIYRRVPKAHVTAINALIDTYMRPFENTKSDNQSVTKIARK